MKQKRKSQLCDDHHRFENGTRFEGLLHFEAVTSGWPTIHPEHEPMALDERIALLAPTESNTRQLFALLVCWKLGLVKAIDQRHSAIL